MVSQIDATLPAETTGPNAGKILVSRLRTALAVAKAEITALQEAGAAVDNSEAVTALQTSVADIETAVDAVELKLSSDNTDLDTMQELVDAIEALQVAIASAGGNTATQTIQDLGDVSGIVNIDMQAYDAYRLNATANVTLNFVNPPAAGVHKPVTVYATRTSASNATISFGTTVSWVGSQVTPSLRDNQTTVFSVSTTNAGTSYLGFSNGMVFEITASGDATTWNPNDMASSHVIADGSVAGYPEGSLYSDDSASSQRTTRAFGAKNSGKWHFCIQSGSPTFASNGFFGYMLGLAQLAHPLDNMLGSNAVSLGFGFFDRSNQNATILYEKWINNVSTALSSFTVAGVNQYSVLVDFNLGKVWFLVNGVPIEGDPEAGTGASLSFTAGDFWYPAASIYRSYTTVLLMNPLNEIENPYLNDFPSFAHWTI